MQLAQQASLLELAQRISIKGDKGAHPEQKITTLIAGMVAGADSINDINHLRHGGMNRLFDHIYAPSTLGSFLRSFTIGHIRQLDAIAWRFLTNLANQTPDLVPSTTGGYVFVDVDDTIIEIHGHQKQGSGFGYSGVRGLNALLATVSTPTSAPVVVAQRLRRGESNSQRGAHRLITDAITTTRNLPTMAGQKLLLRADSAFFGRPSIHAALNVGADVSITVPIAAYIKRAITTISDDAWIPIKYTNAIFDEHTRQWVSDAEVAELPFTAFAAGQDVDHVPGRLVVRRIPELNKKDLDQPGLFDLYRFHAVFTTADPDMLDTVGVDKTHRQHAIIEQVNADLKNSALAHMPSGKFWANSAWLVLAVMAFNLTRTAGVIAAGPTGSMAKATTATIRHRIVAVAARVAKRSRKIVVHLPLGWAWQQQWQRLFDHGHSPPPVVGI